MLCIWICWAFDADQTAHCSQNKTHALNNHIVVNALAGVVGVGITYIKDDEDIIPLLKVWHVQRHSCITSTIAIPSPDLRNIASHASDLCARSVTRA